MSAEADAIRTLLKNMGHIRKMADAIQSRETSRLKSADNKEQATVEDPREFDKLRASDLKLPLWARVWRRYGLLRLGGPGDAFIFLGKNKGMIFALHQGYLSGQMSLRSLCALFVDIARKPIPYKSVNKHGYYLMPRVVIDALDKLANTT